jgi:hypothetical protein
MLRHYRTELRADLGDCGSSFSPMIMEKLNERDRAVRSFECKLSDETGAVILPALLA